MLFIWNWVEVCLNGFLYACTVIGYHWFFFPWFINFIHNKIKVVTFCRYRPSCRCMHLFCIYSNIHNTHSTIHFCFSCSALGLWFFIRRGKQCLDFTVTVHLFHMIICWIYNSHPPVVLSWWLVNIACIALMAVIGEYLCMRTELRAIPVNSGPKSNLWIFCWQSAPEELVQLDFSCCLQRKERMNIDQRRCFNATGSLFEECTRQTDLFILNWQRNVGIT